MSLTNALQIGRSGLVANQAALEVTGNNLANAATPGYTRQTAILKPATPVEVQPGMFVGTGVTIDSIIRNVDAALDNRIRNAIGDQEAAVANQDLLSQIESIYNEFSDSGLSSRLTEFFNAFSELANDPTEGSLKSLVVQQGVSLSQFISSVRSDLTNTLTQLDNQITGAVQSADALLDQIAVLNQAVSTAEGGQGGANALRDERDQLINELAELDRRLHSRATQRRHRHPPRRHPPRPRQPQPRPHRRLRNRQPNRQPQHQHPRQVKTAPSSHPPPARSARWPTAAPPTCSPPSTPSIIRRLPHLPGQPRPLPGPVRHRHLLRHRHLPGRRPDPAAHPRRRRHRLRPENGTFQIHVTQKSTGIRNTTQIDVDLDGIGGPRRLTNRHRRARRRRRQRHRLGHRRRSPPDFRRHTRLHLLLQ